MKPLTAFVLAGGGSLGAVQVGMLKALARAGVVPDLVVGASVGAINGVFYAGDPTPAGVERIERIWLGLSRRDVFPFPLAQALLGLAGRSSHVSDPSRFRRVLEPQLPFDRLEKCALPCAVVATDLIDGTERVYREGPAMDLLLASAAIPAVYPPVLHEGRFLVDGGLSNNEPVSTAVSLGATKVIALSTGFSCARSEPPRGAVATALHALNLLINRRLVRDLEETAGDIEIAVVPPLCPVEATPFDFSSTAELIRRAEASTRLWLRRGGLSRRGIPAELSPHGHSSEPADPQECAAPRRPSTTKGRTTR
ncbi:MAG: patatin-like phospholipase family protein [Elusimicrobia bacterium]|nr:patatin-like phospholipase family protein [Elusimicrobiota bacterium]